ncbi:MAG: calcium/sodium antiporter [Anaeroplasmataceae bacterium]
MSIFLNILFLAIGVGLLIKGADIFVMSSSSVARKWKISPLIIGLTIVSFGTSAPELAVSITASLKAAKEGITADIAMGNVIGSNIMNLLVVLGLSSIITPIAIKKSICKKELPFLILSTVCLVIFSFDVLLTGTAVNVIARGEGLVLLLLLAAFMYMLIRGALKPRQHFTNDPEVMQLITKKGLVLSDSDEITEEEDNIKLLKTPISILLLILGLTGIIVGAEFVATPARILATKAAIGFGLDPTMATTLVGLTIVAIATSLPELVTSVVAARKGQNDIAFGNIIGSNIFNTIFIVGAAASITNLGINTAMLQDILIMLFVTVLVFTFAFFGYKISRKKGIVLVTIYLAYLTFIILRTFLSK